MVTRALAKRPDERYPDARSMLEELLAAVVGLGGTADLAASSDLALMPRASARTSVIREAPTRREASASEPLTLDPATSSSIAAARGSRATAWVAGSLLLLTFGLGGAVLVRLVRPEPARPAGSPDSSQGGPVSPRPSSVAASTAATPPPAAPPTHETPPSPSVSASARPPSPAAPSPPVEPTHEPSSPSADASPYETRLARARAAMERELHTQALEEARSVLRTNPLNAEARDLAARAEAAVLIEESLKQARIALNEGRKDDALEQVRRGLTANPSEPRLLALFREATQ